MSSSNIKQAFDSIHAGQRLKDKTKADIAEKMEKMSSNRRTMPKRVYKLAAACAVFAVMLIVPALYFTPVYAVSIDVNPSVELKINRFYKIVSVQGKNDDGREIAEKLKVSYMDYTDGLKLVLEFLRGYGDDISVVVVCADEARREMMLGQVEHCANGLGNVHCNTATAQEAAQAESAGMSYGKYKAYLRLLELDPNITEEQVRGMTMSEAHKLIQELTDGEPAPAAQDSEEVREPDTENDHHGNGYGYGGGNGNGNGDCDGSGNGSGDCDSSGNCDENSGGNGNGNGNCDGTGSGNGNGNGSGGGHHGNGHGKHGD